jgi:hypothetical protein
MRLISTKDTTTGSHHRALLAVYMLRSFWNGHVSPSAMPCLLAVLSVDFLLLFGVSSAHNTRALLGIAATTLPPHL